MIRKYLVTAAHVSPRFTFKDHPAQAKPAPGHDGYWFATSDGLGCSADYETPQGAVGSLFYMNACTNVVIREET